jgi:hypothetical protein
VDANFVIAEEGAEKGMDIEHLACAENCGAAG